MFKKLFVVMLMIVGLLSTSQAVLSPTTTFNSAMGVGAGSNFDIVQSPDTLVSFGYDWSTLTTGDPTNSGYTTIPASPRGDKIGCRLECNNGDLAAHDEGVTIYPKVTPGTPDYDMIVDIYASYTLPIAGGGTGSTWHTGITAYATGTAINTIRDTDLGAVDPAFITSGIYTTQDGISFGFAPDSGDALSDFYCFQPTARTAAPNSGAGNGQVGTWTGVTSTPPTTTATGAYIELQPYWGAIASQYPVGRDTTTIGSKTAGYTWHTLKVSVRGGTTASFYINNVKFCDVVSSLTTKRVGIMCTDPYTSVASPADQAYVLVDNVVVIQYTVASDVDKNTWMLFQ